MTEPRAKPGGGEQRPQIVVFKTARSPLEAELIVGVLRDAGVPAFVEGGLLTDEFAISQRLMNMNAVKIQVPHDRLADAEAALRAARASAADVDAAADETIAPSPPRIASEPAAGGGPGWPLVFVLAALAGAFLVLWLMAARETNLMRNMTALTYFDGNDAGTEVFRWVGSENLAARVTDSDGDGVAEAKTWYSRSGTPINRAYDEDQNGMDERLELLHPDGSAAVTAFDADQDGVLEKWVEHRAGGTVVYLDADQDRHIERIEYRDGGGALVRAWQWDAAAGFTAAQ
jgi:hypothetical protein